MGWSCLLLVERVVAVAGDAHGGDEPQRSVSKNDGVSTEGPAQRDHICGRRDHRKWG